MKITVIHHSADFDGVFCREIARHFLLIDRQDPASPPPEVEFIGWDFPNPPLHNGQILLNSDLIYVMDLPIDRPFGWIFKDGYAGNETDPRIQPLDRVDFSKYVWIDHHATSILSHPAGIPGYRIDGVAACRLAWQWFRNYTLCNVVGGLPRKQEFTDRIVTEPKAVQLAGEYDIWDKRNPEAETFQYALRCGEIGPSTFHALFYNDEPRLKAMLFGGGIAQRYAQQVDAETVNARSFLMRWEELNFLCINSARYNSQLFAARDIEATGHDALLGFCWMGKKWLVSLYHAKHRTELDLSAIALKHGGGGHRGAAGFTCKTLPFEL
jgi:hypothetical protein